MFFFVYKTTNLINGKYYIGAHKTSNTQDGYLGSGLVLNKAIQKYGRHNFKRQIIGICDSLETMYELEKELVTSEFIKNPEVYNAKIGGWGGSDDIEHMKRISKIGSSKLKELFKTPEFAAKFSNSQRSRIGKNLHWLGKSHSEETREKMRQSQKIACANRKSLVGFKWMNNGLEDKFVSPENISIMKELNWVFGKTFTQANRQINKEASLKGRIMINNGSVTKMIVPDLLDEYINSSWRIGRLISLAG